MSNPDPIAPADETDAGSHREEMAALRPGRPPMASARAALSGRFLISHHIAKTAGTSLAQILVRNIPQDAMVHVPWKLERISAMGTWHPDDVAAGIADLSAAELERRWYVGGHIPGSTSTLLPRAGRIVTMLRDPAERAISNFYAVVRRGMVADVAADAALDAYLREPAPHYWFSDTMLRSLSGAPRLDPFDLPLTARVTPDRAPTQEDVSAALRHLAEDCALVGIAERFDEFLVLFAGLMSWSLCDIVYARQNIRDRTLQPSEERPELKAAVLRWNQADSRLYAEAVTLQARYRDDYGSDFAPDCDLFAELNGAYLDGAPLADLRAIERERLQAR